MPEVRVKMPIAVPESIEILSRAFAAKGFPLYVVGGAVRDAVMGKKPKDFDVATSATPDQVMELLEPIGCTCDLTGKSFGVVRAYFHAMVNGGVAATLSQEYEIATFRQDMTEGRHPVVRYSTIEEDVKRRDFTMNALFYDVQSQEVVDLVGGLEDIKERLVRAVGNPRDRFREDRLRIMRAVRFASTLDFQIALDTLAAIREDNHLSGVSFERTRIEFVRAIDESQNLNELLGIMDDVQLWERVLPGLEISKSRVFSAPTCVVLALLLRLNDPAELSKKLLYLKYSNEEVAKVTALLRLYNELGTKGSSPFKLRKLFLQSGLSVADLGAFDEQKPFIRERALKAFYLYLSSAPVSGDTLVTEGFSGRALGIELEQREARIFEGMVGE